MQNNLLFTDNMSFLNDSNLYGGVSYKADINPEENFQYGNIAIPELTFTTDYDANNSLLNRSFIWSAKMMDESAFTVKGTFKVVEVKKKREKIECRAYSKLIVLDRVVDSWLSNLSFPITLQNMYSSLCYSLGLSFTNLTTAQNANFLIRTKNFSGTNITGRQMMSYIAAAAFSNVVSGSTDIVMKRYNSNQGVVKAFTNADYKTLEMAEYDSPAITGLQIQSTINDVGYVIGTPNYVVTENPIFYSADQASQTTIQGLIATSFPTLMGVSYKPFTMELIKDFNVGLMDRITINGVSSYVMSKEISNSGVTIAAVATPTRAISTDETNHQIQILKNQTNELTNTVSEHTRTLTTQGETISTISQKSDSITATIEGTANYTEAGTAPSSPRTGDIWKDTNTAKYYQWSGTAWVEITADQAGNLKVVNSISQTLDGVVYQNSLGTTVINGDNITTGTIQANRINMTGAISWGDMNSDMQGRINSSGNIYRQATVPTNPTTGALWYVTGNGTGYEYHKWYTYTGSYWELIAEETELPSYIHSTYIDETTIMSPTIQGADIDLYGGTFDIFNASGTTQYGYMGLGNGSDGISTTNGVVLSYGGKSGLGLGDFYVIVTNAGVRMTAGQNSLYVTSSGVYKTINGVSSQLGACVFA